MDIKSFYFAVYRFVNMIKDWRSIAVSLSRKSHYINSTQREYLNINVRRVVDRATSIFYYKLKKNPSFFLFF